MAAFGLSERLRAGQVLSSYSPLCRKYGTSGYKNEQRHQEYSTEAAAAEVEGFRPLPGGGGGWDFVGAREYLEYRRALYGEITHKAVLVDAVGTLVVPSQPMAQVFSDSFFSL